MTHFILYRFGYIKDPNDKTKWNIDEEATLLLRSKMRSPGIGNRKVAALTAAYDGGPNANQNE